MTAFSPICCRPQPAPSGSVPAVRAGVWFIVAAAAAVVDWIAVAAGRKPLEYAAKPATLLALIAAALAVEGAEPARQAWFVGALICSLAGDVFLMLPSDRFVAGLASFLLGHLAYIAGFWVADPGGWPLAAGIVVVVVAAATLGGRILAGVRHRDHRLVGPVLAYMAVLSAMVALGIGSRIPLAAAGALLFYASDALIAWTRFVRPAPKGPLAIIVTYHLAQAALVASLA